MNKRRIAAFALAGLMTLSMAAPAMAAEHTITITDSTTKDAENNSTVQTSQHTLNAYQVFKGTIAAEGTDAYEEAGTVTKLANIEWGSGVNGENLLKALQAATDYTTSITNSEGTKLKIAEVFADCETATDVAEAMAKFSTAADIQALCKIIEANVTEIFATNNGGSTITVPSEGYYFIKDATESLPDSSDAYSDYILQILDDKEIQIKTDAPYIQKKILDGSKEVDASSAQIGEVVRYQWTSTVPNTTNYEGFYYYYMTDEMDGLVFDESSVTVWIDANGNNKKDSDEVLENNVDYVVEDVEVDEGEDSGKASSSFTVAFLKMLETGSATETKTETVEDKEVTTTVLKYAGKNVYVDYSATLSENCTIGETGNPNTVKLSYSNNPTYDYTGTEKPGEEEGEKTGLPDSENIKNIPVGETPEDTVITYTTEVDLTKYADHDEENYELEGAEFTLTGTAYKTVVETGTSFKEVAEDTGDYYQLKDGTYTTEAPVTTDTVSMRALTDAEKATATDGYVVRESSDTTGDKQTDVKIGDITYRVVTEGETPDYILSYTKANSDLYQTTTKNYVLDGEGTIESKEAYEVSKTFTTGADGKIYFKGLDAGTYTLRETVVPDGYNKCDDITFTVKFNGEVVINNAGIEVTAKDQQCDWTITDANGATFAEELGKFATNIIDKSGIVLPTTGGIGTTIFYALGSVLVVFAGVVLVARRRIAR